MSLSVSLNRLRIAQLLACWQVGLLIQRKTATNQTVDPTDMNEAVKTTKTRGGCFFIQNITWPNENPASGKQHACNDSIPERGSWTPLASWLECGEQVNAELPWETESDILLNLFG